MVDEGKIYVNDEGLVVVERKKTDSLLGLEGVTCVGNVCRKVFRFAKIFLPDEYEKAVEEVLSGVDTVVIGMNGYSSISSEQMEEWGIQPDSYESACGSVLWAVVRSLQTKYPGVVVKIAHGASDMGVDLAVKGVCSDLNLVNLGHSCPRFMFYVKDDPNSCIHVSATQEEYANAFVKSLDILVSANGRAQSFQHDILAVLRMQKHLIPINILRAISTKGGPPAIGVNGEILDATAAFERLVHGVSVGGGVYDSNNPFKYLVEHVVAVSENVCQQRISARRAYGRWRV